MSKRIVRNIPTGKCCKYEYHNIPNNKPKRVRKAQKENKNMLDKRYKIDINAFSFLGILLTLQLPVSLDWKVLLSLIYLITGFWIEEEE